MIQRIVTIGGGSGQPELLRYLKKYPYEITAIVSPMDNGGSSGTLRKEYAIVPPGDLRRCLLALSEREHDAAPWWEYRFETGSLAGHTVGNLILAGLMQSVEFHQALDRAHAMLGVQGRVLPMSDTPADVIAELTDGTRICGETAIDVPAENNRSPIQTLSTEPVVHISAHAKEALERAQLIVFTMGDLYTSVLPNLLVDGACAAIHASGAPVVYVCNRSIKVGETHNYSHHLFVRELNRYLAPARVHILITDNEMHPVPPPYEAVRAEAKQGESIEDMRVIRVDLADPAYPHRVSGKKAAAAIHTLCASL